MTGCSVVVVTYQSGRHIGGLLSALEVERDGGLDLDVRVVDNGSTDETRAVVSGYPWVRWTDAGGNLGYSAGINLGAAGVPAGRPLLILNPDLVPEAGAVRRLLDELGEHAPWGVGVLVPRLVDADGRSYPSLRNEPSLVRALVDAVLGSAARLLPAWCSGMVWSPAAYAVPQYPDWATGAALLVSGPCREATGSWDESYFLYSEETDYLRRARQGGWLIRYEPAAVARHVGGGSGTSDPLFALMSVNSVRYFRRWHGRPATALYGAIQLLHHALRARRSGSRLALRALMSSSVRAGLPRAVPSAPGTVGRAVR